MQVNLGDKIRALRKRDSRKQEDLAKALGVTAQAISRWEANGGYPDMSMIPAIANYFHITIDELFGYNNVREEKINECVVKANKLLLSDDEKDLMDCINMLREGLEEFPSEKELQYYLAHALNKRGPKRATKLTHIGMKPFHCMRTYQEIMAMSYAPSYLCIRKWVNMKKQRTEQ